MKRKIVSYLSYDDYASLRMACQRFSQEFECIENISKLLHQDACGGRYKRELAQLKSEHSVKYILENEQNLDIRLALQHIGVRYAAGENGDLIVSTQYLPNAFGTKETYRIPHAIERSQKELPPLVFCASSSSFIPHLYPSKSWSNTLLFRESTMDVATIKKVFATFQKTYNDTPGHEKLVIAGFASVLKHAWLALPPAGVSRADIAACVAPYDDLIQAGDIARKAVLKMPPHPMQE
ncbi:hypothetical protein [Vagococcus sp. WN89Y]|uniref:hypothetical protein n=1 Tax=Vagococcus sp. WN89Y TaxID=3457258 RepID=UPI003FCCF94D